MPEANFSLLSYAFSFSYSYVHYMQVECGDLFFSLSL